MTTVFLAPTFGAGYQGFGLTGLPLNAGLLYTYIAGGTTPQATYTTSAGNVQNANPIVLGADGRPPNEIWLTNASYRFDLKDSLGNLIKTQDNLSGSPSAFVLAASTGATLIGWILSATGAVARLLSSKLSDVVSVKDFGATGDGTTDDTAACQAAIDSTGGAVSVYFPPGTYKYSALIIKQTGTRLFGAGRKITVLKPDGTGTKSIYTNNLGNGAGIGEIKDFQLCDLTLDYSSIASSANNAAVYLWNSYNNLFSNLDLTTASTTTATYSVNLAQGVFTTLFHRVDGCAFNLTSPNTDRVTTVGFVGGSATFLNIGNALDVHFSGGFALQGDAAVGYPVNKCQISNCYNVSFIGCDFEAGATNTLFAIDNTTGFLSLNNNLDSTASPQVFPGTYFSDLGGNKQLAFMDTWAFRDGQTFIPVFPGTPTYSVKVGQYRRVGDFIDGTISAVYTLATPGGAMVITGLPATSAIGIDQPVTIYTGGGLIPGAGLVLQGFIPSNSTQINITTYTQAGGVIAGAVQVAAATINIQFSYRASTY